MILATLLLLQLSTTANPLGPPEGGQREPVTAAASAAANELMALAMKEGAEDTDFPQAVRRGLDDTRAFVRSNAYASIAIALGGIQRRSGATGSERYDTMRSSLRPLVLTGIRDRDGVVRRYALNTLIMLDVGSSDAASTTAIATRLFDSDAEPTVRAAALDHLVSEGRSRSENWRLIERALDDPSPTVKAVAVREAAATGEADALPYLLKALQDDGDQWSRLSAAAGLKQYAVTNPEVIGIVAARVAVEPIPYVKEQMTHLLNEMRAKK